MFLCGPCMPACLPACCFLTCFCHVDLLTQVHDMASVLRSNRVLRPDGSLVRAAADGLLSVNAGGTAGLL